MKILVTGGAGFIGSHLVDNLIAKKHNVVVVDNLSTGKRENLNPKAKFYKISILDKRISQIFVKERPEIVFHYAGQISVRHSIEDPLSYTKVNILGSLNIIENCKNFKVKKFIFPSSVGVYGEVKKLPVKENYPLNPLSPYLVTKVAIEKYLFYYQNQGLNSSILRYTNVFGPRQSNEGEAGVVSIFINKILKNERPVIFGQGNQTRDFLYVEDAVSAAIKLLNLKYFSVYNVGTNQETSIKNLLNLIYKTSRKKILPVFRPSNKGEILKSRADFSEIKRDLGWQPINNLEKGLQKTTFWFKNEKNKNRE